MLLGCGKPSRDGSRLIGCWPPLCSSQLLVGSQQVHTSEYTSPGRGERMLTLVVVGCDILFPFPDASLEQVPADSTWLLSTVHRAAMMQSEERLLACRARRRVTSISHGGQVPLLYILSPASCWILPCFLQQGMPGLHLQQCGRYACSEEFCTVRTSYSLPGPNSSFHAGARCRSLLKVR